MRDCYAVARQYAVDILSGKIVHCKWTRLAIERNEADLLRQNTPAFPYCFDANAANYVCGFLELLQHTKGAKGGERLVLEPWQCFYICTLFGWKKQSDGRRRFRRSLLFCGKGNGKSFLSSGLCLYMLGADGEKGAEVVCPRDRPTRAGLSSTRRAKSAGQTRSSASPSASTCSSIRSCRSRARQR